MRVLAVTNDASLAVTLRADNRQVTSVRSADEISSEGARNFDGTVVDVGTTHRGLKVIRELADTGVTGPFVLLGDVEASVPRPDIDLLVRPFTLEQLDERLSALPKRSEEANVSLERRSASRSSGGLLGRFRRKGATAPAEREAHDTRDVEPSRAESAIAATTDSAATESANSNPTAEPPEPEAGPPDQESTGAQAEQRAGAAEDLGTEEETNRQSPEAVVSAPEAKAPVVERDEAEAAEAAEASWSEAVSAEAEVLAWSASEEVTTAPVAEPEAHPEPESQVDAGLPPHRPKPQIHPHFRSETLDGADALDLPSMSALRRVLALAEEIEGMLDERPHLLDLRAVANWVVDEVEGELRPDVAAVWVPREDKTYEAFAARGLSDVAVGIRVPEEQSLFVTFTGNVDAVLVAPLDVSQRPVSGIPGLIGESLVASALRLDQTLLGIVVATGTGYTSTDRDRLASLASRAAPDFAIAALIERLRSRRFVPGTSNRTVRFP